MEIRDEKVEKRVFVGRNGIVCDKSFILDKFLLRIGLNVFFGDSPSQNILYPFSKYSFFVTMYTEIILKILLHYFKKYRTEKFAPQKNAAWSMKNPNRSWSTSSRLTSKLHIPAIRYRIAGVFQTGFWPVVTSLRVKMRIAWEWRPHVLETCESSISNTEYAMENW